MRVVLPGELLDLLGARRRCGRVLRSAAVLAVTAAMLFVAAGVQVRTAAAMPRPAIIAAMGDSITRAADVCCWYGDHPANSWATGGSSTDGVLSHRERLERGSRTVAAWNDARSGARMADAPAQALVAVQQQAEYVTILFGANDLCTSSVDTMTSPDAFRAAYAGALETLHDGLPNAHVFVASIPDVYHLWEVLHTNWRARLVWDGAGICPSLLSSLATAEQRRMVADREAAFNQILAEECAKFAFCRWDDGAVFNYRFAASQVSSLDYFHPNLAGQAALADVTWRASWWA